MSINNLRATIVHFTWDFIRHPQKHSRRGEALGGEMGELEREWGEMLYQFTSVNNDRLWGTDEDKNGQQIQDETEQ